MIYDRLKTLCKEFNTNPSSLCIKITGSSGNLPTWQKGNIRSDYLIAIAKEFNVSTDYLLCKTDIREPADQLTVPDALSDVAVGFDRGEFEGLTQDEINALAVAATALKANRKL